MRAAELLRQTFERRLEELSSGSFYGRVVRVDEAKRTCDVDVQGVQYNGILLYAVENVDRKGTVKIPAVESIVLVARIDGSERLYVALFSEVDKMIFTAGEKQSIECTEEAIEIKTDETTFRIGTDGMVLNRKESGLLNTLEKLCDALCALTVTTGVGPSGVPINVKDFLDIKADLANYLT